MRRFGSLIFVPIVIVWSVFMLLAFGSAGTPKPLTILRVTPEGEDVPPGRRIVFQFDRPVVPLGRMDRSASEIPITIKPTLDCQWRWLNPSALSCQLNEKTALRPATRYKIDMNPGIRAEDGATLSEPFHHTFVTERPAVRHAWFKTWKSPGMPYIRLTFTQPVVLKSVEQHVFMLLEAKDSRRVSLKVEPDPDIRETPRVLPVPGEKIILITNPAGSSGETASKDALSAGSQGTEARRVWLVSPETELPPDTKVELKIEPGLMSALGPEPGIEERVLVSYDTFPQFRFTGVECTDNTGTQISLGPGMPLDRQPRCNPLGNVSLVFTSPVISEEVRDHVTITPDLAGGRQDYDPWANRRSYSRLRAPHTRGQKYPVFLPEVLEAFEVYTVKSDAKALRDEFGRTLMEPIDMQFATDHRLPDFTLTHARAVLEKAEETEMPIVVTNLESLTLTYDRLTADGKEAGRVKEIALPQAEDVAFRIPLNVREMLDGKSGVVQGTIRSNPSVSKELLERWFFAQVTPFQIHLKAGHYNTLVWVTDLAGGEPVAGATVKIHSDTYVALKPQPPVLTHAKTNPEGIAMLAGTREIDPDLSLLWSDGTSRPALFVRVEKGNDLALMPLNYDFEVDTFRASSYSVFSETRRRHGHIHTWGTTAQGIYKAGDTIRYKIYVRNQDNETLVPPPKEGYSLKVLDPMGKTVHEVKELLLSEFGAFHGEFTVPAAGAVGWYAFQLSAAFYEDVWIPMRVLVSDFTPAPFRVTSDLNGQRFQPGEGVEITTRASLHAGGPYADAPARVTATLESRPLQPQAPLATGFYFDTHVPEGRNRQVHYKTEGKVDDRGALVTSFTLTESDILYGRLVVESAVRDDRGKYIAGTATAGYAGRDRYVGLRQTAWVLKEDEPASVEGLVVDENGKPVADTPIAVLIERRETKAARVKGAGNAYLTQYTAEWVEEGNFEVVSGDEPVTGVFTPRHPGSYRITATVEDTRGRSHSTRIFQWVTGKGRVVWEETPDNRLEIIPEKNTYGVGETARYLLKNPFPGARALITVERYGVLASWVKTLDTSTPVIEFEVLKDYLPGYFLSVVVMSPRVARPVDNAQVDLGKPAFRMGYVKVPVNDPYKEINVEVSLERETYKPRDRVKVCLKAAPRNNAVEGPIELAVTVLDESVLDLLVQGRDYFDPYKGFYTVDGLDLKNYSLLMRLVGRQMFEKKGATTGGGGGLDIGLRSVFKFVSYWNPSLLTDARGEARIEFEAPDNLTGWRVLAMAVTPGDRMGLGDESFKVNRPTEIRPVMPNQVTAGDSFVAGFSVMSRTDQRRDLSVTLTAEGPIETGPGEAGRSIIQSLTAEPYKRTTVWLPLKTTAPGRIRFAARGGDALDQDGVVHFLPVRERFSLETAATYGTTVSEEVTESILFPEHIRTDVGGVRVVVSPSVIGHLEGAFRYLRDYPYPCWEQILTRGVMAAHYQGLKQYMPENFKWEGSERLPRDILERASAYQAPNGGMAFYVPEDRYVSPYLSAYTALAFGWLRKSGFQAPATVEENLHGYLLTLLRRNVVPDFYSKGMASTVRSVALAALAEQGRITGSDISRYRTHVQEMSLFGKAHFLMAALMVPGTEATCAEVCGLILSHSDQSGGKFVFSETIDDSYTRILASSLRTNGAVLSALLKYAGSIEGNRRVGDIPPKLVRFIIESRKSRDHWENTQENMFCMKALLDYSRTYELETPEMEVRAWLDHQVMGETRFTDLRDEAVEFQRSMEPEDPGRKATLKVERRGRGRLYYAARLSFAPGALRTEAVNAGIEIHREYSVERDGRWVLLQSPMELKRGELVRVDLYVSLGGARNFVVVDDPVPGGLEPVSRDLATASRVDAEKGEFQPADGSWWFRYGDWSSYGVSRWSFYHQELRHEAVRFYSEYLPAGNYHLSYTAQAIAPGDFIVLPVRAEEMYNPEVFGKGMPSTLVVQRE